VNQFINHHKKHTLLGITLLAMVASLTSTYYLFNLVQKQLSPPSPAPVQVASIDPSTNFTSITTPKIDRPSNPDYYKLVARAQNKFTNTSDSQVLGSSTGTSVCGESCTQDSDCLNGTLGAFTICNDDNRCASIGCPDDTVFGTICYCATPTQMCGERCGSGLPLCTGDSVCTYTSGPACIKPSPGGDIEDHKIFCVPYEEDLPLNYSRPYCVTRDTGNHYFLGPESKIDWTQEEVIEVCNYGICGNGVIEPEKNEQCDDGNTNDGDGCSSLCELEFCGNGVIDYPEQCDDGNRDNFDGCSPNCQNQTCGNNIREDGEQCDDGNTDNGDV
jgi:cysteine-rich repeat protein